MIVGAVAVEELIDSASLTVNSRHHHRPGWPSAVARVTGDDHEHAQVSDATRCGAMPCHARLPRLQKCLSRRQRHPDLANRWRKAKTSRRAGGQTARRTVARSYSETRADAATT